MRSMRAEVKQYLVDGLGPLLGSVTTTDQPVAVDNGWPGKNLQRNHCWPDRVQGTVVFPFMQAGDKTRDDTFKVLFWFQASSPGDSLAECDARAELYAGVFEDMIAADPSLGDMDGLIAAWFDGDAVEGPAGSYTDEGAWSVVTVELTCQTRTF